MNAFYQVRLGVTLVDSHRDDEGIATFKRVLEGDPRMRQALVNLTYAYAGKKMYAEAFDTMQANAGTPALAEAQRRAYADGGFLKAARLRPDTMAQQAERTYVSPFAIAGAYARAGERDLTLHWLEKAFDEHETTLVNLGAARAFDFLRGDPRFETLRDRMKFPD
ncbi:MAG: TPR end-of-group domain-containing protein [Acidobacteriota bacterium]